MRGLGRALVRHRDPYAGLDEAALLRDLDAVALDDPGEFRYSNMGYALLGHLLQESLESPFPVSISRDMDLPRPQGFTANGRRTPYWGFDAYAGAGGMLATPRELLAFTVQLLDPDSSQAAAALPRAEAGGERQIGLGWLIEPVGEDATLVWHNGGTGGFRSFAGAVPERDTAVVVLANSAVSVDPLARALVSGEDSLPEPESPGAFAWAMGILMPLLVLAYFFRVMLGLRYPQLQPRDALETTSGCTSALLSAAVWPIVAPAAIYTAWTGMLLAVLSVAGGVAGLGVVYHRRLPGSVSRHWWQGLARAAAAVGYGVLAVALVW